MTGGGRTPTVPLESSEFMGKPRKPERPAEANDLPETITLRDDQGLTLPCYVERTLEVEDRTYLLLSPVDIPIEVFAWEDDEETLVDLEDDKLAEVLPTARAVLAEQNLVLQNTAVTLTATGELPDSGEVLTLDFDEEGEESEQEFQELANFYHQNRKYAIYTPVDPLLFFARLDEAGRPQLLSPEEFEALGPALEADLWDDLD